MRVGLLYVDNFEQERSQKIGSLGLGYIAAYLNKHLPGIAVDIAMTPEELIAFECDIIGVSAYSETLPMAVAHAKTLKQHSDIPLVLGGPHIATNPLDLPEPFDLGVPGEGEEVFLQLVKLCGENGLTPKRLGAIQGVTFYEDGALRNTGRAPDIMDMDSLAHPNRLLMFRSMYKNIPHFEPTIHIHTARGCPYRCTFCSAPLVNPRWRFHSPEWVVEELELIARQFPQFREITISDDLFTLKKSRLETLVKQIRAADLHKRFAFFCSSRSNTMTHDMARLLRDMNMVMVSFGLESAADRVIRDLKGVGTSQGDYERVLDMCDHYGIYAHGNFIVGAQDESVQELQETWQFVRNNHDRLASVYFSHMTPFPGTKVWEDGLKAGRFDPETLDYRVLNLEYEQGTSVFLNTHYDEGFYAGAFPRFKRHENYLNDRYYQEQTLIADVTQQERQAIPELILQILSQMGWKNIALIAEQESWVSLKKAQKAKTREETYYLTETDVRVVPHTLSELKNLKAPPQIDNTEIDGFVLFYTFEQEREPHHQLPQFFNKPLLTINYNMASYPILSRLLVGEWREGIYGLTRRRFLRYFTLHSLNKMLNAADYLLVQSLPNRIRVPINYDNLYKLLGTDKLPDPDTLSYISLFAHKDRLPRPRNPQQHIPQENP